MHARPRPNITIEIRESFNAFMMFAFVSIFIVVHDGTSFDLGLFGGELQSGSNERCEKQT